MPKGSPGQPKTPEHREKLRIAAKNRYQSQIERDAQSVRLQEAYRNNDALRRCQSPESKAKQGRTLKQLWDTPEYRLQLLRSRREHLSETSQSHLDDVNWLRSQNETRTCVDIADELGCSPSVVAAHLRATGTAPIKHYHQIRYTGGEDLVIDVIRSLGVQNVVRHDRRLIAPLELDIVLPDQHLAIEYNGAYWHSYDHPELPKERQKHADKAERSRSIGLRLLQFWDTEWSEQPEICTSILRTALKLNTTCGARKCQIIEPSPKEVSHFLNTHHLQGTCASTHAVGLVHDQQLAMIMTIGPSRFRRNTWELLRLATASGLTVVGGAQRLWSHLHHHIPDGMRCIAYADRRLFTGNIYETLGFRLTHHTPPGYAYYKNFEIFSRWQFQKHLLAKKLTDYRESEAESDNMFRHGYRRLWDAGQWVYEWNRENSIPNKAQLPFND